MKRLTALALLALTSAGLCAQPPAVPVRRSLGEDGSPFAQCRVQRVDGVQTLDLSGKELGSLEGLETIEGIQGVERVVLFNNRLTTFPEQLFKLPRLKELILSNNRLTSIPPTIAQLKHLTHLDLSYNQVRRLPDTLGALRNLQVLYLEHNRLDAVPTTLKQMKNLRLVLINDNELARIPQVLHELDKLCAVDLSGNNISIVSDDELELKRSFKLLKLDNNPLDFVSRLNLDMSPDRFDILTERVQG